jgi:hypothetical protein
MKLNVLLIRRRNGDDVASPSEIRHRTPQAVTGHHMFPTTDSNLCAHSLVEQVLSLYALGAISRCRLHHRGLNDTYKVEGSLGDTYFLRIYRANWRSQEEIQTEIAILLHLAREKASVSIPVGRKDGQVITPLDCVEGGRRAVLFTSAPGKEDGAPVLPMPQLGPPMAIA